MTQNKIDEELVCADSLVFCLKHRHGCHQVDVRREENDPPDFWITVNGVLFAAEVTSVVEGENYHARGRKLREDINKTAHQKGCLAGSYALSIKREPIIPKRNSDEWHNIIGQAISFIEATKSVTSTEAFALIDEGLNKLTIEKCSAKGEDVGLLGPITVKWGIEIQEDLCHIMNERIIEKRKKLENKGVHKSCPQIMLLLYDAYGLGEIDDAQKALLKVNGYDWFHSIFWAASFTNRRNEISPENPGREGMFLYSQEEKWWRRPQKD